MTEQSSGSQPMDVPPPQPEPQPTTPDPGPTSGFGPTSGPDPAPAFGNQSEYPQSGQVPAEPAPFSPSHGDFAQFGSASPQTAQFGPQPYAAHPGYYPQQPHYPQPGYPAPPPYGAVPPGPVPGQAPKRRSALPWLIGGFAIILLLCCGGATTATLLVGDYEPDASAQTSPSSPVANPSQASPRAQEPTTERSPQRSPEATSPARLPKDRVYRGRGDKVVNLSLPSDLRHTAEVTHDGSGHFAIWLLDVGGEKRDLLVNTVGRYSGVRPLDFSETPRALRITADGSWTITVRAFPKTPLWSGSSSGRGPTVLRLDDTARGGLTRLTVTHSGSGNFVVWVFGERGRDLLINEIGRYSGQTAIPSGTVAVSIEADGAWTIKES